MSDRDIYNSVKVAVGLTPDIYTADKTDMAGVDTKGFSNAMLVVNAGAIDTTDTDETYAVKVYECDTVDGTYTDTGLSVTVSAAGISKVQITNLNTTRKRYLQAYLDVGGTTPSFEGSAEFVLGGPVSEPVA